MGHEYSTYAQFAYHKEDGVFDLRKIFDLRKFFAVPKNFLKSKIHCIREVKLNFSGRKDLIEPE